MIYPSDLKTIKHLLISICKPVGMHSVWNSGHVLSEAEILLLTSKKNGLWRKIQDAIDIQSWNTHTYRGFIKGQGPGKLTVYEYSFAQLLPPPCVTFSNYPT